MRKTRHPFLKFSLELKRKVPGDYNGGGSLPGLLLASHRPSCSKGGWWVGASHRSTTRRWVVEPEGSGEAREGQKRGEDWA